MPSGLDQATARLRAHLLATVDPAGALRSPCDSRVLETALCLRLLERSGLRPDAQASLKAYLSRRRDASERLDRALVTAALEQAQGLSGAGFGEFLTRAPGFTSHRKQAMITGILSLFGVPATEPDPAVFSHEGLHIWAKVQVTALKVITYRALRRTGELLDGDYDLLASTQNLPDLWEGNVLIHLSVLHALVGMPGTAAVVEHGAEQVLRHQRADGGLPFVTDTDTWTTATGGVALSALGAPPAALHRMAGHLVGQQRSNGGWAYTDLAEQTDVDDISVATEFLHGLDPDRYASAVDAALAHLRGIVGASGGFPTYVKDAPAEACMTAAAVNALGVRSALHEPLIRDGLRYLDRAQHADGSFGPDWSASSLHTVFRAVLAAGQGGSEAGPEALRVRHRALERVIGTQNPDGGWGWTPDHPSDAVSTAYALIALCAQDDPGPVAAGLGHLLSCQRADGSVESTSDSIGPRPFVFRVAALADVFCGLALGHVASRLEPERGRVTAPRYAAASSVAPVRP
ncbi:prenyltransferase/squalene oxidase repeat-containing protein [Streptomyces sp.]|uniref:prenyltransferase/squalene oxidase repeat-containing protein n=1 Tax=Streptomyces sp. TaxID=1931 RepID=UPI002F411FF6